MTSSAAAETPPPWYKQFWPWFLISIPGATVIAGFFTLYLAIVNQDALVTDDYYRVGVTINSALAEMDKADELGVVATVEPVRQQALTLQLPAAMQDRPNALTLDFRHPTLPEEDFSVQLAAQADTRYVGSLQKPISGRWMVVLSPAAEVTPRWRLEATWHDPQQQRLTLGQPMSDQADASR